MNTSELYKVATKFRNAIIDAKRHNEFKFSDRMSNFPGGCCDDTCDLFAYYLIRKYNIETVQGNGAYYDDFDSRNNTNHSWLMFNNFILDLTADQFCDLIEHENGVYVGIEAPFYRKLERKKILPNCDITKEGQERLFYDYNIILKYMI